MSSSCLNLMNSPTLHFPCSHTINSNKQQQCSFQKLPPGAAKPDDMMIINYSQQLKSCIRSKDFQLGIQLHRELIASGLQPDTLLLNSLITLYSKYGDPRAAYLLFLSHPELADLVSWSAIVSSFANNRMEFEALVMFKCMLECSAFFLNEYCYTAVLRACSNPEYFHLGLVVFGAVIKTGFLHSHVCVGCALIDLFVKGSSDVHSAYKVFSRMREKNAVSWTLMITRIQQLGYSSDAISLFSDMLLSGYVPDRFTLSGVISACAKLGSLSPGQQLHSWVVKSGLVADVCVGCSLIDMYAKCAPDASMAYYSRKVFDWMPDHNVMSWTATIAGYANSGGGDWEAFQLFCDMIRDQEVKPNHFTLAAVVKACANLSNLLMGQQVHAFALKMGLAFINCFVNSLISMYVRCGSIEHATKAFDLFFEKHLVAAHGSVVDASFIEPSQSEELFEPLHYELEDTRNGVGPFNFASLLSGASSIVSISKGEQIHARVVTSGLQSNLNICNALIAMYSCCGNIDAAFQVFDKMVDRSVVSWTSMVSGFAKHGFAVKALETFNKMLEEGVRPNSVTYNAVLSACSHVGLIDEGWLHFKSMSTEHGILPRMEHYACMVDLLGRSGRLIEALQFINSMPFKADDLVLRTFLGACRVHGNADLGKQATEMILEQKPHDPAAHILLSNLYASEGQWEAVAQVRKDMKARNLTKEAGCSWVEVGTRMHKFYVGDTLHKQSLQIYKELDRLALEIRELGYVPDTNFVLHDVEEEQKEQYVF